MADFPTARWCRSRRAGAVCTRPAGHAGLHNRMGTGQMWSDREADAPRCDGSGRAAAPAALLPDGFPHGLALCPVCWGFVPVQDDHLAEHDFFRGATSAEESTHRAEWFNAFGWDR